MAYNCIVIAREVWDSRDLLANVVSGDALNESALTKRFEPEDLNSLEQALQLKEKHGGTVTVLSVGTARDVDVLRESLFRGVDKVIRVISPVEADTAVQAQLLAAAIQKVGDYNLILTGVNVPDAENSMLGTQVAGILGIDQISYVDSLVETNDDSVLAKREIEMGSEFIRLPLPCVLVLGVYLLKDDPRTPRAPKAMLKLKKKKEVIPEWTAADLGLDGLSPKVTITGYEAVPQPEIETQEVDAEDAGALKAMLQEVL